MRKEPKVTMYDSGVKITGKIESNLFEVEYTFENIHSKDFLNEKTGKISSFAIMSLLFSIGVSKKETTHACKFSHLLTYANHSFV